MKLSNCKKGDKTMNIISCRLTIIIAAVMAFGIVMTFSGNSAFAEEPSIAKTMGGDMMHSGKKAKNMSKGFYGTVTEVIDAGRYVYVQVNTGKKKVWVAAPAFDGNPGDRVEVPSGVPIADFQSKKLNRKFDIIYFVGGIRQEGKGGENQMSPQMPEGHPDLSKSGDIPNMMPKTHPPMDELAKQPKIDIGTIEKAKNGQTVGEIINNRVKLAGKEIRVRAKVVKFTPNIMDKNWLHIQDGSGEAGENDLIVTTDAKVKVGDVVLVRGKVSVDRDFGFGLKYRVIIENAEVTRE